MKHLKFILIVIVFFISHRITYAQYTITGQVIDSSLSGISGARITLFDSTLTYFIEERTDIAGNFTINNIPAGNYSLGVEKISKEYSQQVITVPMSTPLTITLLNETHEGLWSTVIQAPEGLGGTNLGILMPNGNIFYCHSTKDPFYFDPVINDTIPAIGDTSILGCTGPLLMPNGLIVMAGGTMQEVYGPGRRRVKSFDYITNAWIIRDSLLDNRWYPTVTKLADNRILVCGGGNLNNPQRTNTSEIYDASNWSTIWTDTLAIGNEVSPNVLLHNGKVLLTHRPPQLYDPLTMQWDSAGQFVQGPRTPNGDHADHELVQLSNGEVIAVGYKTFNANLGTFIERYNPVLNTWTLGSSIPPIRSRAKTVLLPNEKIIVIGGEKEDSNDTTATNQWGYMGLCDEYDPASDSWRRLSRLSVKREYHCNTILVPDGRIIAVGGEGQPGNEPAFSYIEAFEPPYLFRGIRPVMSNLSTANFQRGSNISFDINFTDSLTAAVLIATQAVTHFMNAGNNRFVHLNYLQNGLSVSVSIPNDSLILPDGFYILFGMVDDIPSIGKIVSVSGGNLTQIIETNSNEFFSVYPNPADKEIRVDVKIKYQELIIISLIDITGKIIRTWNIKNDHESIFIEGIKPGSYLLECSSGGYRETKKIVIVNGASDR